MLGICVTTIWSGATIQVLLQRNAVPDVQIFFIECLCFLHEIGLRKDGNIKGSKSIVSPVSHTFLKIIPISLNILGKRLPKQYRALNTTTKSNMTVRDLPKDAAVHRCSFKKLLWWISHNLQENVYAGVSSVMHLFSCEFYQIFKNFFFLFFFFFLQKLLDTVDFSHKILFSNFIIFISSLNIFRGNTVNHLWPAISECPSQLAVNQLIYCW